MLMFSLVYGDRFIDLFERGLVKSLGWPENRAAIQGAEWRIYSMPSERESLTKVVDPLGVPVRFADILTGDTEGQTLMNCMADHARVCVEAGKAFLAVQPDHIFGDGSIRAMKAIASENSRLCVAMPHPRVLADEFLTAMPDGAMQNCELVSLAMRNLHPSFEKSNLALDEVNVWLGGVAWRVLGDNLWGVTANLPTIFLARLTDDDLPHLTKAGAWDHTWPSTLMPEQRQRVIGSSDAAFTVELTDRRTHIPKLRRKPPGAPYTYRYDLEHHRVNRNVMAIWRGLPST